MSLLLAPLNGRCLCNIQLLMGMQEGGHGVQVVATTTWHTMDHLGPSWGHCIWAVRLAIPNLTNLD